MATLETNPLALKGKQFLGAIKEYNATRTLPENFMGEVLDALQLRDGYMPAVFEYGDRYERKSRFYVHKVETKGVYKGDYQEGKNYMIDQLCSLLLKEKPQEEYIVAEYSDDLLIDGKLSNMAGRRIPDIQEYLSFPFTEDAVWQLFLVYISYTVLPLFWHGCYSVRTFFFDRQSFIDFEHKEVLQFADSEEVIPKVEITGDDTAIVKCCFWNDWRGLCREEVTAKYADGKVSFDRENERLTVLVPYDCKIRY